MIPRSVCLSSFKAKSRNILVRCRNRPEVGIIAMGLSILTAQEMMENNSSSQTTTTVCDNDSFRLTFTEKNDFEDCLTIPTMDFGAMMTRTSIFGSRPGKAEDVIPEPKARFPTLHSKLLTSQHEEEPFSISANQPIAIDNELFAGQVMLVLRPLSPEDDPAFERRILEENATFQIQLQGRFKKRIHKNSLYVGAELVGGFNLGSVTKKISQLILALLCKKIGNNISYSFGSERELPRIAFPLHTGMDNVVLSDKSNLPRIGREPFVESEESKIKRKTRDAFEDWNTEGFYSMSYCASSIDFPTWRILLPFEMDLSRFWGSSPVRLVIYVEDDDGKGKEYLFNLQLKHLPTSSDT